ncbi:V-set and transmembrane domain-containing protein 2B [Poeciliopsis prolifica]|uniref:V-set and transmembrane domain-containing protein 2B n=1 Tax=Poeciliopsis prolifica TaxID=188132 RepID=UPI00241423E2|nr:V-set and transmembrane domain-containing protein 2B [Poeciliopsis prolifica]XP_054878381.1 V-set and transmembrane domain-containing protein 2B [Poeciliopsis prolifica]
MEKSRLYKLFCYFVLNSQLVIYADAAFTEIPKDVSVGEGEDVEMPCAFKALSSAPISLEIQWWYIKLDAPKEGPNELQNRAKGSLREATKISTVRVHGNAISHRLSLSKVKKEDGGVYECRVSDMWAEEDQNFTVHATLTITAGGGMVAEEAVSHIQNRWSLRNTNAALGGSQVGGVTSKPSPGSREGQEKQRVPQLAQPDLLPSVSSTTTTSVAKSAASQLPGSAAVLWPRAACSMMSTMDPLCFITLLFLHKLIFILLAH